MKLTITLDDRQADVVLRALDLYSRLGMGQLSAMEAELRMMHPGIDPDPDFERALDDAACRLTLLPPGASWGIASPKVPQSCREAYDLQQQIRRPLAVARGARQPCVDLDPYHPCNPEWPPIAVEVQQPVPSGGEGDCWQELIDAADHPALRALYVERRDLGIARYGQPLRRGDGRDEVRDLREELLDAMVYAQRLRRDSMVRTLEGLLLALVGGAP